MKIEMRRQLARQPFEQKICRVGQLIQLAATLKAHRASERGEDAAGVAWLKEAGQSGICHLKSVTSWFGCVDTS